jgi:hypothetical protein
MYVDEGIVGESAFYFKYAETLVYGCEVCYQMVNFRIHEESRSKFVFLCLVAVIPIARKGLWIVAIVIMYFHNSLIVMRRPPGL